MSDTILVEGLSLSTFSMDELPEDALTIIAETVSPAGLFTVSLLAQRYKKLVNARVVQLAALRGPPFNLTPSIILGFLGSSRTVNLLGQHLRDQDMIMMSDALASGAMAQLQVSWHFTALIPCLGTWHVCSPGLKVSFGTPNVPFAGAFPQPKQDRQRRRNGFG